MYYSYNCPYCSKVFYTFNSDKNAAAGVLYNGIKKHLIDYDEDSKEHEFDDPPEVEANQVCAAIAEFAERPSGGYEL